MDGQSTEHIEAGRNEERFNYGVWSVNNMSKYERKLNQMVARPVIL